MAGFASEMWQRSACEPHDKCGNLVKRASVVYAVVCVALTMRDALPYSPIAIASHPTPACYDSEFCNSAGF